MITKNEFRRGDVLSAERLAGMERRIRSLAPDKARFAPRAALGGEPVPFGIALCSSEIRVGAGWAFFPESLDFSESRETDGYETDGAVVATSRRNVESFARTSRMEFEARVIPFSDADKGTVYVFAPLTRRTAEIGWGGPQWSREEYTRSEDGNAEASRTYAVYEKRAAWLVPTGEIAASRSEPDRASSATIAVLQDGGLFFHLRNNIFLFDFDLPLDAPVEILDATYDRTLKN